MSGGNPLALAGHEAGEMELDDSVLWSRAAEGDTGAFALLFKRHAKAIYNYCFRRIGDWSAAEDLLSVVFLEAWRRRDKDLPPGKCCRGCTASRRTSSATAGARNAATARRSHGCRPSTPSRASTPRRRRASTTSGACETHSSFSRCCRDSNAETTWHVRSKVRGGLRYCVRSFDAAGNRSNRVCANLDVR